MEQYDNVTYIPLYIYVISSTILTSLYTLHKQMNIWRLLEIERNIHLKAQINSDNITTKLIRQANEIEDDIITASLKYNPIPAISETGSPSIFNGISYYIYVFSFISISICSCIFYIKCIPYHCDSNENKKKEDKVNLL